MRSVVWKVSVLLFFTDADLLMIFLLNFLQMLTCYVLLQCVKNALLFVLLVGHAVCMLHLCYEHIICLSLCISVCLTVCL